MTEARPLIGVRDVVASSHWYQAVLGAESGHGGSTYEQIIGNGRMILQLHAWDDPEDQHEHMGRPDLPLGNGVLLWFRVEDFDSAMERVKALGAKILDERFNQNAQQRECWMRDPDGYVVVLAGPSDYDEKRAAE